MDHDRRHASRLDRRPPVAMVTRAIDPASLGAAAAQAAVAAVVAVATLLAAAAAAVAAVVAVMAAAFGRGRGRTLLVREQRKQARGRGRPLVARGWRAWLGLGSRLGPRLGLG
eukprot:scaffold30528_cov69-Phaeocystis_antarctica.AAC.1